MHQNGFFCPGRVCQLEQVIHPDAQLMPAAFDVSLLNTNKLNESEPQMSQAQCQRSHVLRARLGLHPFGGRDLCLVGRPSVVKKSIGFFLNEIYT